MRLRWASPWCVPFWFYASRKLSKVAKSPGKKANRFAVWTKLKIVKPHCNEFITIKCTPSTVRVLKRALTVFFSVSVDCNNNVLHFVYIDSFAMMTFFVATPSFRLVVIWIAQKCVNICKYANVCTYYFDGEKLLFSLFHQRIFCFWCSVNLRACIMQHKATQSTTCSWIKPMELLFTQKIERDE